MSSKLPSGDQAKTYFYSFEQLPRHTFTKHTTSNGAVVKGEKMYVGLVNKPRGSGSQPHRHPFEQFNYVLKGKLKAWVDGEEQVVPPGGLIHIPANTLHTIVATPEEDVIFFMIKEVTSLGTAGIPEDPNVTGPRFEPGFGPASLKSEK
ncbi:MAG TPA: cupin domain-containing protein [Burkholderiales bacterium]|jgi:quercetin dioxygenase-like cupin family protein|nr:cupin domain-containing protein [Burkholderiales bacterium]